MHCVLHGVVGQPAQQLALAHVLSHPRMLSYASVLPYQCRIILQDNLPLNKSLLQFMGSANVLRGAEPASRSARPVGLTYTMVPGVLQLR